MSFTGQINFGYPITSQNIITDIPNNAVLPLAVVNSLQGNILGVTFETLKSELSANSSWGSITGNIYEQSDLINLFNNKQNILYSGSNIKTINGNSILGGGNLTVGVTDGDKGDITVSGGGNTWTVDNLPQSRITNLITDLASKQANLGFTPENVVNKSTDVNLGTSNTLYPTQNAVKTYADNILGNANALVYKGVVDCSANPNYPAANAGEMYIVSVAGKIGGVSGEVVEVGDMLICNNDATPSGTQASVGVYWNVIQKNINGAVSGPASSVNNNVVFFDGTTGKLIKDSGLALSGSNTGDETQATIKTKLGAATTSTDGYLTSTDWNTFNGKQATLTSGTNIKTINGSSILGSGDLTVGMPDFIEYNTTDKTVWNNGKGNIATNTSFGESALSNTTSGLQNAAFGYQALLSNSTGNYNNAFGYQVLRSNTTGSRNHAFGYQALYFNTTGVGNVALGASAASILTTGNSNAAIGANAGQSLTTGSNNTIVGNSAGATVSTGSNNVFIGAVTQGPAATIGSIVIGSNAGATEDNQMVIGSSTYPAGAIATETITPNRTWTVRINGFNYKIPLLAI